MAKKTEQILKYFNLDEQKDEELIASFNLFDKGSNCFVIHPGSHSLKIGLASQNIPFLSAMAIAHPTKKGRKLVQEYDELMELNA
jgi:actin-related protein